MEPSQEFWEKISPRVQHRLELWKCKSFNELIALPESTSDGKDSVDGHNIHYSVMSWHRDPDSVILVVRASVSLGWKGGRDFELGFVMSSNGQVRTASEEEVRSLW